MLRVAIIIAGSLALAANPAHAQDSRVYGPLPEGQELALAPAEAAPPAEPAPEPETGAPSEPTDGPATLTESQTESLAPPPAATAGENAAGRESLPLGAAAATASVRDRLLGASEPASLPAPGSAGVTDGWWRTAASLGLVIGLVLAIALCFRRWAAGSAGLVFGGRARAPSGLLEVLARYPVGRGQQIILLRADRRVLVLHQNSSARSGQMRTLSELTDPEEVASILSKVSESDGVSASARFREMVNRFDGGPDAIVHEPVVLQAEPDPEPDRRAAPRPDPLGSLQSRLALLRSHHAGERQ